MTDPAKIAEGLTEARKCKRCHGTGWWAEFYETGWDGCMLIGGRCDHREALDAALTKVVERSAARVGKRVRRLVDAAMRDILQREKPNG